MKKLIGKVMVILAVILGLSVKAGPVLAQTGSLSEAEEIRMALEEVGAAEKKTPAKVKNGLRKENNKYYYYVNGKKIKGQWKDVTFKRASGDVVRRYYFKDNGAACTRWITLDGYTYVFNTVGMLRQSTVNKLFTVGSYQYCPDRYGRCQTGWLIIGNKLYYAAKNGRIVKNRTVSGVTFKNSTMVADIPGQLKLKQMQVVRMLTNSGMSRYQKLQVCWNWLTSSGGFTYLGRPLDLNNPLWAKESALTMLNTHMGDCVSFACAFAAMASEIGYKPVMIYGRVPGSADGSTDGYTAHCWVIIDRAFYDPEGQYDGWNRGVFGSGSYPYNYQVNRYVDFATGKTLSSPW